MAYIDVAPTIATLMTDEEIESTVVVKQDPMAEYVSKLEAVEVPVIPEITKEAVEQCLPYFKWWRRTQWPTEMGRYVGSTYEQIAARVGLTVEQVVQLHAEYDAVQSESARVAVSKPVERPGDPIIGGAVKGIVG